MDTVPRNRVVHKKVMDNTSAEMVRNSISQSFNSNISTAYRNNTDHDDDNNAMVSLAY